MAHRVQVRPLLGDDPALLAQPLAHRDPGLEAIQAVELGAGAGDPALLVEHRDHRQVVPAADLEVVRIVRRGHLHRTGAEGRIDVGVGDDRDQPAGQRQLDFGADQVPVALVVRVHGHRGVAQHGLDPGGGHHDRRAGAVGRAVDHRHQLALDVAVVDLGVRQHRAQHRRPVDQPLRAVDQAVVVEPLEHGLDRPAQAVVHGEALPGPVHAVAEPAHLAEDGAAVLLLPRPDPLDEGVPAEFPAAGALGGQGALDQGVHGDAGVVHAGQPERLEALHPGPADQCVHQGVLEGVPDVQAAGDVRRWDHDGEGRLVRARVGGEVAALHPALVERPLDRGRHVLARQLGAGSRRSGGGLWGLLLGRPRGIGHP